jgi:hypothetical protein
MDSPLELLLYLKMANPSVLCREKERANNNNVEMEMNSNTYIYIYIFQFFTRKKADTVAVVLRTCRKALPIELNIAVRLMNFSWQLQELPLHNVDIVKYVAAGRARKKNKPSVPVFHFPFSRIKRYKSEW